MTALMPITGACGWRGEEMARMRLVDHHVIYHARTAFEDDPGSRQVRLLYRLWLSMPDSRPLPPGHEVLWGAIEAGVLRGGIGLGPGGLSGARARLHGQGVGSARPSEDPRSASRLAGGREGAILSGSEDPWPRSSPRP